MQINNASLIDLTKGFKATFTAAQATAAPQGKQLAMTIASKAALEIYPMLAALPGMREFLGEAVIQNAGASTWQIANKKWESTIAVKAEDIERDSIGLYAPMFASMGVAAEEHEDELLADLLTKGFTQKDYTGKHFFDTAKLHNPNDKNSATFSNKGTKKLSAANYGEAKAAFKTLKNGAGRPMGLGRKLQLVVSPKWEDEAKRILNATLIGNGADNIQKGTAELVVFNRLGDSDAWYLFEAGLPYRALIIQDEVPVQLRSITKADDSRVLLTDEYIWQAYKRSNCGYGLPQLAWGSTGADAA